MKIKDYLYDRISYYTHILLFYLFRIFPIKNNKIVFSNFSGKGFGDNPKYICEKLMLENKYDLVWTVEHKDISLPTEIRPIVCGSIKYVFELSTAKIWVDNCRKFEYVRKRKKQYYVQTWHGDIGPKKIEGDAIDKLDSSYIDRAKNDSKMIDLMLSGNIHFTNCIRRAFGYTGEICECGMPRRDILYSADQSNVSSIKKKLGIPIDAKIVLYAPTFRDNQDDIDMSIYDVPWKNIFEALNSRFEGSWYGIVRLHPNIAKYSDKIIVSSNCIDCTNYPDMQELLLISDICISDYSSSIYEFAVTKKPGFIYAKDYNEYRKNRDVLFDMEITPFPMAISADELVNAILNFDKTMYLNKWDEFYYKKIGLYNEGKASEIVVQYIEKRC